MGHRHRMHLAPDVLRAVHRTITPSRTQRVIQRSDVFDAIAKGHLVVDDAADGTWQVVEAYGRATRQPHVMVGMAEVWAILPSSTESLIPLLALEQDADDISHGQDGWTSAVYAVTDDEEGVELAERLVAAFTQCGAYEADLVEVAIVMVA